MVLMPVSTLFNGIELEDAAFSGGAEHGSSPCAQITVGCEEIEVETTLDTLSAHSVHVRTT